MNGQASMLLFQHSNTLFLSNILTSAGSALTDFQQTFQKKIPYQVTQFYSLSTAICHDTETLGNDSRVSPIEKYSKKNECLSCLL